MNSNHAITCRCNDCKKRLQNPLRICTRCKQSDTLSDPFRLCIRCRNYLEKLWLKKFYESVIPIQARNPNPKIHVKPFEKGESAFKVSHQCGCWETEKLNVYCQEHGDESKNEIQTTIQN